MMKKVLSKRISGKGIESINTFLILFISIFLVILTIILLFPVKVLLSYEYYSGEYLKSWMVKDDEMFTVHYTHSVELCPVSETYYIDNEDIILSETYFESYGAGLPANTEHSFEMTESGFRIYNIDEKMDNLIYRTGAEGTDPKIRIRNKDYRFLDFSKPRDAVGFKIKRIFLINYLTKEAL